MVVPWTLISLLKDALMLRCHPSLLATLAFLCATLTARAEPPAGFTAIFNEKDLIGWHGMPHFDPYKLEKLSDEEREGLLKKWNADAEQHWRVENGELVNDGKGAYLTTDKEYGDIELLIDYKTVAKADSGIYLRASPQVQIWDYTEAGGKWKNGADKGSGGLFNNALKAPGRDPLVLADKPFGEWNHFRIVQVGERTTVYLNDKLVVNHARMENYWKRDLPLRRRGPIQLQTHGGEIRWRNLYVREIPPAEATEILRTANKDGFQEVFNGKDFTGWSGQLENYEIKDGAIFCKLKKGGNIFTNEQYSDFAVRLEYKVPPAGNNGLAIRYPGKGRASADAMCEIQILDNDAPRYVKLDPRQANGAAYGIAPAQKGYQRPANEWNFMEVTVRGSQIQVEVNGTRIMDADLSKITTFKDNLPHPGKDRTSGHFGFCGHNDPVGFRNIQIKRL